MAEVRHLLKEGRVATVQKDTLFRMQPADKGLQLEGVRMFLGFVFFLDHLQEY